MCSRIIPISFQIAKAVTAQSSKHLRIITTAHTPSSALPSTCITRRAYSEQAKFDEMVVDYEYVKKAIPDKNVLIIDVREPGEVEEHGKIPNSINIHVDSLTSVLSTMPEEEFQKTYQRAKPSKETEIIFYCKIGRRSRISLQNAVNLGYKNVKDYSGSWTDWATKLH